MVKMTMEKSKTPTIIRWNRASSSSLLLPVGWQVAGMDAWRPSGTVWCGREFGLQDSSEIHLRSLRRVMWWSCAPTMAAAAPTWSAREKLETKGPLTARGSGQGSKRGGKGDKGGWEELGLGRVVGVLSVVGRQM